MASGDKPPISLSPTGQARFIFSVAAWFGLLAGLGEVGVLAYMKFRQHAFIHLGADVIWMTPWLIWHCSFPPPG